ncbi:hypothetical protein TSUD_281020 [Trifolium subterraneum]|uniref:Uncharacterized protein n=1 Tax=Trifolium subterraneum TaxID=3900 RepID=A0A2Z6NTQ9_TRISU|nr:hypothetical protein TSUD_281020 [Trifolium subterraneum]
MDEVDVEPENEEVVKVTDDNFPIIHQFIDVISVDPVPKLGDENRERVPSITSVPASSVLPTDSEGYSRQQLYQHLSNISEHPPPPKPTDRVVIPTSSLNLSLLVTTAKPFSMLQTSLQLFDKMPQKQCHIAAWSAIIKWCMNNEQVVAFDLFKDMHSMLTTTGDLEEKHMLCAARLLEMLNLYASNHENYAESDPIKNFIIEEIKVSKEVKWIGLPNFTLQAAFLLTLEKVSSVHSKSM